MTSRIRVLCHVGHLRTRIFEGGTKDTKISFHVIAVEIGLEGKGNANREGRSIRWRTELSD